MDCAPFIRTNWVLATWLTAPLLVLIVLGLAVRGYYNQQWVTCEQKKTLAKMVPLMQEKAAAATQFLGTYRVERDGGDSAQDIYIGILNTAAATSGFMIETILIDQETLDRQLGTAQILMRLEGNGNCRQFADFLNRVKKADPLIYENNLTVTPTKGNGKDNLRVDAEFIKIYLDYD